MIVSTTFLHIDQSEKVEINVRAGQYSTTFMIEDNEGNTIYLMANDEQLAEIAKEINAYLKEVAKSETTSA